MTKILVIDDRADNLLSIKAILQNYEAEYEVITAQSGAIGIELAKTKNPDTVLLDINMPDIDGYEVCRQLRSNPKTIQTPIVFLTAVRTSSEDRIRGLELGGDAYLTKPINSGELIATINAMLRIKKAEDAKHRQFDHIVSSSSDMIALINSDFVYQSVNKAYAEAFKLNPDQFIDKTPSDVFGEDVFEATILPHGKKCLEGELVSYETQFDFPAHGMRIMEINYYPYHDEFGKITGFVVNGRNISGRKQAEEALHQSEEKYRLIVENANDGIEITQDDRISFSNARFAEMLGYTLAEIENTLFSKIFTKEAIKNLNIRGKKRELGEVLTGDYETTLLKKGGDILEVDIKYEIIDYQGKPATFSIIRDITERKQAERVNEVLFEISNAVNITQNLSDLYQSIHNSLNRIIDVTNFFIALVDVKKHTLYFPYHVDSTDDDFSAITNFDPDDSITGLVVSQRKPLLLKTKELEERATKNGVWGPTPVIWMGAPLIINDEIIGVVAIQSYENPNLYDLHDLQVLSAVSDQIAIAISRKNTEDELRKSESRYSSVVQDQTEYIIRYLPDGTRTFVNDSYCKTFNVTQEQALASNFLENMSETGAQRLKRKIVKLTPENPVIADEHESIASDGTKVWRLWVDRGLFDKKGALREIQATGSDITKRKQSESALRESEQINKSITQTAADAIITIDANGKILSWNHAAETIFGYSAEKMINAELNNIIPDQHLQGHLGALKRLRHGGRETKIGTTLEISAVRKDGTQFPIELALSSWESDNQKYYTGIIRDISERKTAELEITEALSSAEAANKVKDQFIANISHEIRTPLNSILGFSDLLEKRLKKTISNQDHQLFGYITKSSNRLMKTVDFILNNSQLQAGTIKIQPRELDLSTILNDLFNEFKPLADEKSLEFELISTDKSMLIFGDEYCIRQAISNIIENALKYTFEGNVKLSLGSMSGQLSLSIIDTGIGISKEYQKKIFDAYTQESEGFTKDYQGIGLGLALTKQYLDLNNVVLEIESKKDVGSTFTLIFPINKGGNDV